jgi:hypothetical protein
MDLKEKSHTSKDPIQHYINEVSLRLTNEQKKLIERTLSIPGDYIASLFLLRCSI